MSLLPRDTAWYRMLKLRLLVTSVMILFIGAGSAPEAGAQSSTTLRLIDLKQGNNLSSGAQVAVFSREGSRAYSLSGLKLNREDIESKIREGSVDILPLTEGGKTSQSFKGTRASGKVYYVLALTPEGKLFESYPNLDGSYKPGLALVESGDITMGLVPKEYRDGLRDALNSAMSTAGADTTISSQAKEDTAGTSSPEEEQKRSKSGGGTSGEDSGNGYLRLFLGALYSRVGALLFGLLVGGLVAWWTTYRKYRKKLSNRRQRIDSLKSRNYKLKKKNREEKKDFSFGSEKEESKKERKIKNLKSEIKKKNKELNRKKEKIRKMREEGGEVRDGRRRGGQSRQSKKTDGSSGRDRHSDAGASANRSPGQELGDRTADLIGRAFVKWCKDAGAAMVDRHSMFAKRLEEGLPEAELQRIFREKNAAGIVFADDVQDAVEYWLVRVDGKDFLLPQPQRSGFREVEKCFQATCTSPKQLREFEPAELQSSGGKYELKSEGRLA